MNVFQRDRATAADNAASRTRLAGWRAGFNTKISTSLAPSPRNRSSITPNELRVRPYNRDHTMAAQPARPQRDPDWETSRSGPEPG